MGLGLPDALSPGACYLPPGGARSPLLPGDVVLEVRRALGARRLGVPAEMG